MNKVRVVSALVAALWFGTSAAQDGVLRGVDFPMKRVECDAR